MIKMEESMSELRKMLALDDNRFAPGPSGFAGDLTPTSKYISSLISSKGILCFELFELLLKECVVELSGTCVPEKHVSLPSVVVFAYAIAALRTTSLSTGKPLPNTVLPILLKLPTWVLGASMAMVECCIMFSTQVGRCLRLETFVASMPSQSLITIDADTAFSHHWHENENADLIRPLWSQTIHNTACDALFRCHLLPTTDISEVTESWTKEVRSQVECDGVDEAQILAALSITLSRAEYVLILFKAPV